jgi:hypothetical protein
MVEVNVKVVLVALTGQVGLFSDEVDRGNFRGGVDNCRDRIRDYLVLVNQDALRIAGAGRGLDTHGVDFDADRRDANELVEAIVYFTKELVKGADGSTPSKVVEMRDVRSKYLD